MISLLINRYAMRLASGVAAALAIAAIPGAVQSAAAIDIVTSTPELADIARQVGGDGVSVYSVAKPNQDYHSIEARPSDVARLAKADIVVRVGLDLDMWMDSLINSSRNARLRKGAPGYVDASVGIKKLEIPKSQVSGASGDIHVYGNPHYFYDPANARSIATRVLEGLQRVSPSQSSVFKANHQRFLSTLDKRMVQWKKELAAYTGRPVVTYHQSAIYFLNRFGLKPFGTLEVKPGIPPSGSHISALIKRMKQSNVTAVVVESIYPTRFPDLIRRETGANYVIVPYSVGSLGTKSYIDLVDLWVSRYAQALQGQAAK